MAASDQLFLDPVLPPTPEPPADFLRAIYDAEKDKNTEYTKVTPQEYDALANASIHRIREQYATAVRLQKFHFHMMARFYSHYYTTITLTTFFAVVAGLVLVTVSKGGWNAAPPWLITLFVLTSAATALFGACPALFRLNENINDHKAMFLNATDLGNDIRSYLVTFVTRENTWNTPMSFAHAVDAKFKQYSLFDVAVGFDASKVPSYQSIRGSIMEGMGVPEKPSGPAPRSADNRADGGEDAKPVEKPTDVAAPAESAVEPPPGATTAPTTQSNG